MEWIMAGAVGLLVIALVVAIGVAVDRRQVLDRARMEIVRTRSSPSRTAVPGRSSRDPGERPDGTADGDLAVLARRLRNRLEAAELELDRQARDGSDLADLVGVGIIRLDEGGTVELANAAAHLLLGRAPGSLRGRTTLETFVDARVEEMIAAARESGGGTGEYRLSGPDGPILIIRARRSPVSGITLVMEDVSELRRLQQIRTEFVDNLSHELRTPLSTVSLLAETLARDAEAAGPAVPPKMRDRIDKIEVETGHLVQMVNELLDLARIESGGPLFLLDDVDLGRVATEAAERLRLFADRQGLRLVVDVPPHVPAVRGDDARLGQVVVNLVHNALKFGRAEDREGGLEAMPGQPRSPNRSAAEVRIAVRAMDGQVVLSVEDHGVGIPRADQVRIFERFYKVDRVRLRGGGTGLGLAIARNVVEQHGGRIRVESEEGRGSIFTVSLPVAPSVGPLSS